MISLALYTNWPRLTVVAGPVVGEGLGVGDRALPDVEIVDSAGAFEEGSDGLELVHADAVVDHVVVETYAKDKVGAKGLAAAVDDLVEEGHALLDCAATVFVGAAVRVGKEELGDEIAKTYEDLGAIETTLADSGGRFGELLDGFLHLLDVHLVGHVLWAGEVGWGDGGGGHERPAQDARCIYHHLASVAELGEERRIELVGGGGHAPVDGDDPVVIVGHGEGDFAIVIDDGVA